MRTVFRLKGGTMELPSEVTSAIITFLGTVILALGGFYFSTRRGNKVVLTKVNETSLLNISKLISDKLVINYKNKPITKLKLYELEITNQGFIDIDNLELILEITAKEKPTLVEVQGNDSQGKTTIQDISNGEYFYLITRPYLNMVKKDKREKIIIQVFTDTELGFDVIGGGKGWGVKYVVNKSPFFIRFLDIVINILAFGYLLFFLVFTPWDKGLDSFMVTKIAIALSSLVLLFSIIKKHVFHY